MAIMLNLGVEEMAYSNNGTTTGDVAQILEDNYSIMEYFAYKKSQEIAKELEKDLALFIEDSLEGKTPTLFNDACNNIDKLFRRSLDERFMDNANFGKYSAPTKAAEAGVSHRFKDVYNTGKKGKKGKKRGSRPSFIDTGLYQQSFKSWVEIK